jgi:hypothetical protein
MSWSWILLLACAEGGRGGGKGYAEDYAGREGVYLELGPADNPQNTPLILHIEGGSWILKYGASWAAAEAVASYDYSLEDGLVVGGDALLPDRIAVGEVLDGAEVTAIGDAETYYGVFDQAATVSIASGPWAGEQVFAQGLGLVSATYDSQRWELAYYE